MTTMAMANSKLLQSVKPRQFFAEKRHHLVSEHVTVDFEFSIKDFDYREYRGIEVEYSSETTFSAREKPDSNWMLRVNDKGPNECLLIKLHLYKEEGKRGAEQKLPNQIQVELAVLNNQHEKVFSRQYFFAANSQTPLSMNFLNVKYYKGEKMNEVLPNGNLTIYCQITSLTDRKIIVGKNMEVSVNTPIVHDVQFDTNMEELFETKKLSDVIFIVGGSTFQSHKCILGARSPVFAAMFEHETTEKLTDKVEVQDIEPEVFQEVLRFIYTGRVCSAQMEEFGTKVLAAADKYLLENLKQLCEEHLVNHLTAENCLEMLVFTDLHTLNYLRQSALNFLRHHLTEVRKTGSWKEMKQKSPLWLCEIQEMIFDFDILTILS